MALNCGTKVLGHSIGAYMTLHLVGNANVLPMDSTMLTGAEENFKLTGTATLTRFAIISDSDAPAWTAAL